ncbi:hypothetical protein [Pantoea vagans]|uniref:hypothetical protein n=1 Tax=Pantoea vagans TaxID=470934 RepID=UPI003B01D936
MIRRDFREHWKFFFISGKTLTELTKTSGGSVTLRRATVCHRPREPRIAAPAHRVAVLRQMLASGFEAESRALFARGDLHTDMPSIRCVGYRQMWSYLSGEIDYSEMVYSGNLRNPAAC